MKKLFITTLFFLAIGLEMKAQAVFMPGYIIDKKGDTLNGEIKVNHKKEIDLYKKIFFRKDEKEAPKQYAPTAIQGFKVEDKFFEPVKIAGQFKFMKVICHGSIMFFEYEGAATEESEEGESRYFMVKDNSEVIVEVFFDMEMKKELKKMFHDDPESMSELEHTKKVNLDNVTHLFNEYNIRNPEKKPTTNPNEPQKK